jgi:hypothetical protein
VTRAWIAVIALAGCYSPPEPACGFVCGPGGACPADYTCAGDHQCHRDGTPPSLTCAALPDAAVASAPRVLSTVPADGTQGVAVDVIPAAIVDQDLIGVSNSTFQLFQDTTQVSGFAEYPASSLQPRFVPEVQLNELGFYRVVISAGITNAAGEPLPPVQWTFVTGTDTAPPHVRSTSPSALQSDVPITTNITVVFDEAVTGVDMTSFVVDAGGPIAGSVSPLDQTLYTFAPATQLPSGATITVTLGAGIADLRGNAFAGYGFSFTTQ